MLEYLVSEEVKSATEQLIRDSRRELLDVQVTCPPVIFHYTDAAGLLGIAQTRRVWATHARFFNDREEKLYGHKVLTEVARSVAEAGTASAAGKRLLSAFAEDWTRPYAPYFIASFSQWGDRLSQWRGYAADGAGFAIGFDTGRIKWQVKHPNDDRAHDAKLDATSGVYAQLVKVQYDPERQHALLRKYVERAVQLCDEKAQSDGDEFQILSALDRATAPHLLTFKNKGFEEEAEWRAVCDFTLQHYVQHRATPRGIAPYLELNITKINTSPLQPAIREVVIGPRLDCDANRLSVAQMIKDAGVATFDIRNVTCSTTPYG